MSSAIAVVYAYGDFTNSFCHVSGISVVIVNESNGKDIDG